MTQKFLAGGDNEIKDNREMDMIDEKDQPDLADIQAREKQLEQQMAGDDKQAAEASNDALINPAQGISILGGKYTIPRISSRSLYLLGKIKSPFGRAPELDDKGQPIPQPVTADEMLEAMYVMMNQDDPRVMGTIADPVAFSNAVYNQCGMIDVMDLEHIAQAINEQMSGIQAAGQQEGVAGDASPGEVSGTTT